MSARPVDVALLFEGAARELDIACALKYLLEARHGLSTEIIQQNHPDPDVVRDIRPAVVVVPFCYQERDNRSYFIRWRDATIFNLTWEQLFYPGNATAKTPHGRFAVRHVIHNAWSEVYRELLRAQGVPDEHIFLSGNPAFTLYDPPYRDYFKPRAELATTYGLAPSRRWIFFPENYNWAFYEPGVLDQIVRDGQPRAQVATMQEMVTHSFEEAMRWSAAVVDDADAELILRPRPATDVGVFRGRVEEVIGAIPSRLHIFNGETVRDWILASDVVISSYSTSLIEASVAGKPAYLLEPLDWPAALHQPWHDLAPRLTSEAQFAAIAAGAVDPDRATELGRWARQTLMSRGDALVLIADELARVRRREVPIPAPAPLRTIILPNLRRLPRRTAHWLRRRTRPAPRRPRIDLDVIAREQAAAVSSVPARVRRWREVLRPDIDIHDLGQEAGIGRAAGAR